MIEKDKFNFDSLPPEQQRYLQTHEPRFERVVEMIKKLKPDGKYRVLDVGPSFLTKILRDEFHKSSVYTLGIVGDNRDGGHLPKGVLIPEFHTEYNLNCTSQKETWPSLEPFDLIIFSEVIEHLYTAPEYVLRFLRSILKPKGILILQTPNAAALFKRLTLLRGKNPYERIRLNNQNPGHFREYTSAELKQLSKDAGFTIRESLIENYFRLLPTGDLESPRLSVTSRSTGK